MDARSAGYARARIHAIIGTLIYSMSCILLFELSIFTITIVFVLLFSFTFNYNKFYLLDFYSNLQKENNNKNNNN
jgi:hypothetical protein